MANLEMKRTIDDFDDLMNAPAPDCEKLAISNCYRLCIHLAKFLSHGDTTLGQKKYMDLVFYCLCKVNVCGVFLANPEESPSEHSIPHMYCLLLAPSLYLLREELELSKMGKFEKLRDNTKFTVSYKPVSDQLFFLPDVAECFENLCKMYHVNVPPYQLH